MMYGCVPNYLVATALAVSLSFGQPLLAQENTGSPAALLVEDAAPLTGFPTDAVTDVLGVRIGMGYDEARQAILAADFPMLENAGDHVSDDKYAPKWVAAFFWVGWEGAVLRAKLERGPRPLDHLAEGFSRI